jgi:hypothetical protein
MPGNAANALGEVLEPGRVPDCYLGLRLDPAAGAEPAGVLVVAPAALLHPAVPQPDGTVLYELVTDHPDRTAHELVFLPDLTVELRAWPIDTWAKLDVDPQTAAGAVIAAWRAGHLKGLRLGGLTAEEALALERPAMTYVREQLRQRLARQVGGRTCGGCTPPADAGPATASCSSGHPQTAAVSAVDGAVRPRFRQHRGHRPLRQTSGRPHRTRRQPAADSTADSPATADRRRTRKFRPACRKQQGLLACLAHWASVGAGRGGHQRPTARTPDAFGHPQVRTTWRSGHPRPRQGCHGRCGRRPSRTAGSVRRDHHRTAVSGPPLGRNIRQPLPACAPLPRGR